MPIEKMMRPGEYTYRWLLLVGLILYMRGHENAASIMLFIDLVFLVLVKLVETDNAKTKSR